MATCRLSACPLILVAFLAHLADSFVVHSFPGSLLHRPGRFQNECRTKNIGRPSLTPRCCMEDSEEVSISLRPNKQQDLLPPDVMPCISVLPDRLILPGQRKLVHVYDQNNMEVLNTAMRSRDGYLCHVVVDPEALVERRFALCEYGVLLKVLSTSPSIHRNKYGERSDSIRAEVAGLRRIRVHDVFQKEPFLAANTTNADIFVDSNDSPVDPKLLDALNNCRKLRDELSLDKKREEEEGVEVQSVSMVEEASSICRLLEEEGRQLTNTEMISLFGLASLRDSDGGEKLETLMKPNGLRLVTAGEQIIRDANNHLSAMKSLRDAL